MSEPLRDVVQRETASGSGTMVRVSMGDVWDDARRVVAREAALLLPLAFATIGLAAVIFGLVVPARDVERMVAGPWMLALLPVLLLVLLGQLALSALALLPRASVGEALRAGAVRLPGAVLASLVTGIAMTFVLVVASIVAGTLATLAGLGQPQAATIAGVAALPAILWLFVRLAVLIPALATAPPTLAVLPAIRRCLALTRGHAGPIAGAMLVFLIGYVLILAALQFAGGAVLVLAGRAVGAPLLGETVAALIVALAGAAMQMMWVVFLAMLYRRLAGRAG